MAEHLRLGHVAADIAAGEFFSNYISKRQPVVIVGLPDDPSFRADKWTDLDYLTSKAGDIDVLVEPMHPTTRQFGTDVERVSMPFRDFLASLGREHGPHHYLTTQYADEDEGAETVLPPPTNALADDFPRVPRMMGRLFLQQVNLWVGRSADGSSSGLHHDFHDNLYCLLRGRKRFVLFPPREVAHLYPHGTLDTLHPNGLITYEGTVPRADGLARRVACTARVRALERKLDALPNGKGKGKGSAHARERKRLLALHDEALDELASMELDEHGSGEDDFDALEGVLDDGGEEVDPGSVSVDGGEGDDSESVAGLSVSGDMEKEPLSFSRIPTALLHKYLNLPTTAVLPPAQSADSFPALCETTAPYVVELSAGQMLYLPASWWHEVTSSSDMDSGDGVHMAFNYWFYPPDALETFDEPYKDTLVWEYLRNKTDGSVEGLRDGKRKPDDRGEGSSNSKKTKR
ncbi:Clavaminate synthase-like protein [Amylocystis lapponica]|nr:Clavaminate synthase-like protein [Amylocystis lapponica]